LLTGKIGLIFLTGSKNAIVKLFIAIREVILKLPDFVNLFQ